MEISLPENMATLIPKIQTLASQRDDAVSLLKESMKETDRLRLELEAARRELQQSRIEAEYLSLSHKLAADPQALADARATVRKMIAKVDKAIRLLEEDARI